MARQRRGDHLILIYMNHIRFHLNRLSECSNTLKSVCVPSPNSESFYLVFHVSSLMVLSFDRRNEAQGGSDPCEANNKPSKETKHLMYVSHKSVSRLLRKITRQVVSDAFQTVRSTPSSTVDTSHHRTPVPLKEKRLRNSRSYEAGDVV